MAYLQTNIPRANKIFNLSLSDFSGGLNNRADILQDNESPDLLNLVFSSDNIMSKRYGQRYVNSDDYTDSITFIDEYIGAGNVKIGPEFGTAVWGDVFRKSTTNMVVATDKKLYINNQFITDVTSTVTGISHLSNYFFVDGGDMFVYGKFPKVAGMYLKIVGEQPEESTLLKIVSPPEGYTPLDREIVSNDRKKVTLTEINTNNSSNITAKVDGKYYKVKFDPAGAKVINDGMEFYMVHNDDGTVTFYDLDSEETTKDGPKHLEGITVYDYEQGKVWYEPCLLEIEDEYKGASVVPDNTTFIVNHKGRIFVSGDSKDDNNVFMSDIENPYYFPVGTPMQIPPDSDRIVKLFVYDDSVIVARNRDIYVITGMTNRLDLGLELFAIRKLNTHTGFANGTSCNLVHNNLFFMGNDGNAYSLTSTKESDRVMVTTILNRQIDFQKDPVYFTRDEIKSCVTHFFDDDWYVQIKDKTLVYSYRHMAWTVFQGLNANSFFTLNGELCWGNDDGRLVEFSKDYLDFGLPYECYWRSKYIDLDEPSYDKHFKDFFITAKLDRDYENQMYASFKIDHTINDFYTINNPPLENIVFQSTPYYINRRGKNIQLSVSSGFIYKQKVVDLPGMLFSYNDMVPGELIKIRLTGRYYMYTPDTKHYYEPDYSLPGSENTDKMIAAAGWVLVHFDNLNFGMKVININFNYEERGRHVK